MTLDEKIKNNITLTEEEAEELMKRIRGKNKPKKLSIPFKSEERKIIDGDISCPKTMKVKNGKLIPKTEKELYKDKVITKEDYAAYQRQIRDSYLYNTDKYMISDFPITDKRREEIKEYRQYLRDITKDKKFPDVNIKELK